MSPRIIKALILSILMPGLLTACGAAPAQEVSPQESQSEAGSSAKPKLGLMTSLPLYWPLGSDFADLAGGDAEQPWQRVFLERDHELVLLDTLSPFPGLTEDAPETDPLARLDRLAIIQPRGLSPADNVALDDWVRAGGHLFIALDPLLTGEYDVALGDPRRPSDVALIPPVLGRWGLAGYFDPSQSADVRYGQLPGGAVPLIMAGESRVAAVDGGRNGCRTLDSVAIARCDSVGKGTVTYLHDAAVFEHPELAGEQGGAIIALLNFAFSQ